MILTSRASSSPPSLSVEKKTSPVMLLLNPMRMEVTRGGNIGLGHCAEVSDSPCARVDVAHRWLLVLLLLLISAVAELVRSTNVHSSSVELGKLVPDTTNVTAPGCIDEPATQG